VAPSSVSYTCKVKPSAASVTANCNYWYSGCILNTTHTGHVFCTQRSSCTELNSCVCFTCKKGFRVSLLTQKHLIYYEDHNSLLILCFTMSLIQTSCSVFSAAAIIWGATADRPTDAKLLSSFGKIMQLEQLCRPKEHGFVASNLATWSHISKNLFFSRQSVSHGFSNGYLQTNPTLGSRLLSHQRHQYLTKPHAMQLSCHV
jgi:hypothetical protein